MTAGRSIEPKLASSVKRQTVELTLGFVGVVVGFIVKVLEQLEAKTASSDNFLL